MGDGMIISQFGTVRGLIRLGLSYPQWLFASDKLPPYDKAAIRRLVFVCHGNICRSAYADVLANTLGARTASFGLSTSSGKPAHPPVAAIAERHDLPIASHRTSTPDDIIPQPGDLLLAMEIRHLGQLAAHPSWGSTPRSLLGLFASPPVPHLHDPYTLSDAYFETCMDRITRSTKRLVTQHPGVIAG